jgi:thioredoxin 1
MFRSMAFTTINKVPIMTSQPISIPENVITEMSKEDFGNLLAYNKGALVIKFGAEWCGPCKQIASLVNSRMAQFPPTIKGAVIDIDDNFEIYALLKSKRIVNGVPVILCYKKGNLTIVPDNVIVGANENQINAFFDTCMTYA